jgi:hypothetical protein
LLDRAVPELNVLRYSLGAEAAALGATFVLASEAASGRRQQNQRSDGWTGYGCLRQQTEMCRIGDGKTMIARAAAVNGGSSPAIGGTANRLEVSQRRARLA